MDLEGKWMLGNSKKLVCFAESVLVGAIACTWRMRALAAGLAAPADSCNVIDRALLGFWADAMSVLITLAVSAITLHHLPQIQIFVTSVMITAGRSRRRLVALGLLLAFVLAILYLAHDLIERLIIPAIVILALALAGVGVLLGIDASHASLLALRLFATGSAIPRLQPATMTQLAIAGALLSCALWVRLNLVLSRTGPERNTGE